MKKYGLIFIALAAISFAACGGGEAAKTEKPTAENKPAENAPIKIETASPLNPTDTLKAFIAAYQKKDVDEMKKYLSKDSLEMFRKTAELQNKTEKDLMMSDDLPFKNMPEMRNEKIEGETASVEVKVEGRWEKTPLVKEDGLWKLAFDKG